MNTTSIDRRRDNVILNIATPIIVATIVGAASAYVGVKVTLSVTTTKLHYIEADLTKIANMASKIVEMQKEVALNTQLIHGVDRRVNAVEEEIKHIRRK